MHVKLAVMLYAFLLFVACGAPDETMMQLQQENTALQLKNDSLIQMVEQLRQSPGSIIQSAKRLIDAGEKDSAGKMLKSLSRRSLNARNTSEIARLLKPAKLTKYNRQPLTADKTNVPVTDAVEDNQDRSTRQPLSSETVQHNWSADTTAPAVKRPAEEKTYSVRVGAICRDGTRSSATGRGACSHHGGVREWVYESGSKQMPGKSTYQRMPARGGETTTGRV